MGTGHSLQKSLAQIGFGSANLNCFFNSNCNFIRFCSIQSAVFTEAKDPAAALAGGLGPGYAAARALQEAYCCLYTTA
jgi:hypothetical protein